MSQIPFFKAEKIARDSYMITNAFTVQTPAICYLAEGENYALLIDTIMGLGDLNAFCRTLTDKPIKVVNTHGHGDHVCGNFHFDSCYIHPRDMALMWENLAYTKEMFFETAKQMSLPEYRDMLTPDENFAAPMPIKVYPLSDGDIFDLGGHRLEVVEAGGHTKGSVVLIDHDTRICYAGDACNGNTLLEFDHSLPVIEYMRNLLRLKERSKEFDKMYGGHEIFGTEIIDEAIETVARVIAGTDDRCERDGLLGGKIYYAAAKAENGYERVDGKSFNMSYVPENIFGVKGGNIITG